MGSETSHIFFLPQSVPPIVQTSKFILEAGLACSGTPLLSEHACDALDLCTQAPRLCHSEVSQFFVLCLSWWLALAHPHLPSSSGVERQCLPGEVFRFLIDTGVPSLNSVLRSHIRRATDSQTSLDSCSSSLMCLWPVVGDVPPGHALPHFILGQHAPLSPAQLK